MSDSWGLTGEQRAKIEKLLLRHQKIEAIKLYRSVTGLGLAEAKAAVEALERGERAPASAGPTSRSPLDPARRASLVAESRKAALAGRKLDAVKLYRSAHGVALIEAKLAADLMAALPDSHPPAPELVCRVSRLLEKGERQDAAAELANSLGLDPQRAGELTRKLGGAGCRRAAALLVAAAVLALGAALSLLFG